MGPAIVAEVLVPGDDGAPVGDKLHDTPGVMHHVLFDAADHNGVADAGAAELAAPGADAKDADAAEAGAEGREDLIEVVSEAQTVDRVAHGAESLGDENGQATSAGDEPDGRRRRGGIGQDRESTGHLSAASRCGHWTCVNSCLPGCSLWRTREDTRISARAPLRQ